MISVNLRESSGRLTEYALRNMTGSFLGSSSTMEDNVTQVRTINFIKLIRLWQNNNSYSNFIDNSSFVKGTLSLTLGIQLMH